MALVSAVILSSMCSVPHWIGGLLNTIVIFYDVSGTPFRRRRIAFGDIFLLGSAIIVEMEDERVMAKLLQSMNEHIPPKRKSIADMLDETDPFYEGKDGRRYSVSKDELRKLASFADPWDLDRIKIPILLMTDTSYGSGYWKIIGKAETILVSRLIDREPEKVDEILIFYPQLNDLRRQFPTTTNAMYMP